MTPTRIEHVTHDPGATAASVLDEVERLRLVVATLDEIRDEVLHGGPVTRTPNEVLDLIDCATAHLEDRDVS